METGKSELAHMESKILQRLFLLFGPPYSIVFVFPIFQSFPLCFIFIYVYLFIYVYINTQVCGS